MNGCWEFERDVVGWVLGTTENGLDYWDVTLECGHRRVATFVPREPCPAKAMCWRCHDQVYALLQSCGGDRT